MRVEKEMAESVIHTKSLAFAVKIVKFCKYLSDEKKEYVLSKQLMRSGTSIVLMFERVKMLRVMQILLVS